MWPILLALVPAFGWGLQGIVMQKVGGTTANKQMGMVLTTLLFGIVVLIFHPINWSWTLIAAAAINGHSQLETVQRRILFRVGRLVERRVR